MKKVIFFLMLFSLSLSCGKETIEPTNQYSICDEPLAYREYDTQTKYCEEGSKGGGSYACGQEKVPICFFSTLIFYTSSEIKDNTSTKWSEIKIDISNSDSSGELRKVIYPNEPPNVTDSGVFIYQLPDSEIRRWYANIYFENGEIETVFDSIQASPDHKYIHIDLMSSL